MMDASATSLPEPLASPAAIAGMAPAGVDAANAASPIADNEPAAQAAPATIPGAAADPRAQITRLSDAGEIHASGDPAMAGTDTAPELLTEGTTLPDPELTLPTDFRARLEAIMVPAQRTAVASDNLTGVWSPLTSVSPGSTGAPSGVPTGPAATLFESLTVLEPLDDRNAWSQGLGERLLLMAERGAQAATLRLQPEHLGPMEIRIRVDEDGATQVLFSAHHAQTRDALENAIPRLRELLADQGLNLMQANVDSGRSSAFAQRDFAAGLPAWRSWSTDDTEVAALPDAALWQIRRDPGRRVDIFV